MRVPLAQLERFFRVSPSTAPACVLTDAEGVWCQLQEGDEECLGNYVPLSPWLAANWQAKKDREEFSMDALLARYDYHTMRRRSDYAYACARIAPRCFEGRIPFASGLSHGIEWATRALFCTRHSFDSGVIEHVLRNDILPLKEPYLSEPILAYRLAMELTSLLNERGHQRLAEAFYKVAQEFQTGQQLGRSAALSGDYSEYVQFLRRKGQILVHTEPDKREWKDFLTSAGRYSPKGSAVYPVVRANLTAFRSFYLNDKFDESMRLFQGLLEDYFGPSLSESELRIGDIPTITNAAAMAELFLFYSTTLAALKFDERLVISHLKLAGQLFDLTCHHRLAPLYWSAITNVEIPSVAVREQLDLMSGPYQQRDGIADTVLRLLARSVLRWLKNLSPRRYGGFDGVQIIENVNVSGPFATARFGHHTSGNEEGMKIGRINITGEKADVRFIENNSQGLKPENLDELLKLLAELRRLGAQSPLKDEEKHELGSLIDEGEAEARHNSPDNKALGGAIERIVTLAKSLSLSIAGNLATDGVKAEWPHLITGLQTILHALGL